MDGLGKLTIRFDNGQRWSMPFTQDATSELVDALSDEQGGPEWLVLQGVNHEDKDQIMIARRLAVQSMMWVEDPEVMAASENGTYGDEEARNGPSESADADDEDADQAA